MSLTDLASLGLSAERGFLCQHDAAGVELDGELAQARRTALRLPEFLPSGSTRAALLDRLPVQVPAEAMAALDERQARMAMVHYSFLAQAWVWGEDVVATKLPAQIAMPLVALADRLGQQPLLQYSGYVLDNWALIDAGKPIGLDNIYMIQKFAGGLDEAWFVMIHVAIEHRAGTALALFGPILEAVAASDHEAARALLERVVETWEHINAIFGRMPERCDPHVYFRRVRPYIHGWKDDPALPGGVVYESVDRYAGAPQPFRGQTGSQSSIVPAMDALLGVGHAADPLRAYLDELHIYRPPAHRRFIDDVRATSTLREFVRRAGNAGLTCAYNGAISAVADFRSLHLEYAAGYINKQGGRSPGNDTEVGTGGTPFMKYLKKHRDETASYLLTD